MPHERKVAVVSGSMGYLGAEVVNSLIDEGFVVAMLARRTPDDINEEKVASLEQKGHRLYICDLTYKDQIEETLNTIEKQLGNIHSVIHTAASAPLRKHLLKSTAFEMQEQFDTNVFASFNFLTECARRLKQNKEGVIVGVTTAGVATSGTKTLGIYTVAKFALQGILTVLKEELLESNIKVYSVAPGFMDGGMNSSLPQAYVDIVRNSSPTGEITSAKDVAKQICELCVGKSNNDGELTVVIAPEILTK